MRNDRIGQVLKEYRKRRSLTVSDVSVIFKKDYHMNVSEKTIYGWESNQSHPSSDKFLVLCEIYQIKDILRAFQGQEASDIALSDDEKELIDVYRDQDANIQQAIRRVLGMNK